MNIHDFFACKGLHTGRFRLDFGTDLLPDLDPGINFRTFPSLGTRAERVAHECLWHFLTFRRGRPLDNERRWRRYSHKWWKCFVAWPDFAGGGPGANIEDESSLIIHWSSGSHKRSTNWANQYDIYFRGVPLLVECPGPWPPGPPKSGPAL